MRWELDDGERLYRLQVAADKKFKKIEVDKIIKGNFFSGTLVGYSGKELHFRVFKTKKKKRTLASVEFPITVNVKSHLFLSKPHLEFPENNSQYIVFERGGERSIFFIWNRILEAKAYELQISKTKNFSKETRSYFPVENNIALKMMVAPVKYYWRVKAIGRQGKSKWSKVYSWRLFVAK